MFEESMDAVIKAVSQQAGVAGTIASIVGALVWRMMNKRWNADKKQGKLQNKYQKVWAKEIDCHIEKELNTHRSGMYGVFSRATLKFESENETPVGVLVHRKNRDEKWKLKELREKFDVETNHAYLWLKKQILDNFDVYYTKVDIINSFSDVEEYEKRIAKDINSLYIALINKFDTEIGAHRLVQESIKQYFTLESFSNLYKDLIHEMEWREKEYLAQLEDLKEKAIPKNKNKK